MDARVHLFGIRHHGPGSAASLLLALDALDPAIVLIEGPPDADALLIHAAAPGMRPPLALLSYAAEDPSRSVFHPFAHFSPEWRALLWALQRGRPARFIDWPVAASLALEAPEAEPEGALDDEAEEGEGTQDEAPEPAPLRRPSDPDPLDRLAKISGHSDGEAFWNALVESGGGGPEIFPAIEAAMTQLRAASEAAGEVSIARSRRNDRREAFMRNNIRKALKETEGAIAVVTGAWHTPALRRAGSVSADRELTRDVPKTKIETCWIPWTDTRLAIASGYGAGVTAPGWYAHFWSQYERGGTAADPNAFVAGWQARVAVALREAGHASNTASAIEAARLSLSLAAMRGHPTPGIEEMRDSALAALCHGDETPWRLIETKLFIGQNVGEIGEGVPQAPLAADLARQQKKLRLAPQALEQDLAFDLRSEAGLAKSVLLHRLTLLSVPWGRLTDSEAGRGTYRELWRLAWIPEFSVKLAEGLIHGVIIEQAAAGAVRAQAEAALSIAELAELVKQCLLADLPAAAQDCIARLQAAAVDAGDIASLMRAVAPLAAILRYGVAREMPEECARWFSRFAWRSTPASSTPRKISTMRRPTRSASPCSAITRRCRSSATIIFRTAGCGNCAASSTATIRPASSPGSPCAGCTTVNASNWSRWRRNWPAASRKAPRRFRPGGSWKAFWAARRKCWCRTSLCSPWSTAGSPGWRRSASSSCCRCCAAPFRDLTPMGGAD